MIFIQNYLKLKSFSLSRYQTIAFIDILHEDQSLFDTVIDRDFIIKPIGYMGQENQKIYIIRMMKIHKKSISRFEEYYEKYKRKAFLFGYKEIEHYENYLLKID